MMEKILFVVTGGEIGDLTFFQSKVDELQPFSIICADGGAGYLYEMGMIPDVIIGDMDSLCPETLNYFQERGSCIIRHPGAKDETDTQLALDYAIGMAPDCVYIFGALGTRIDHALANLSLLISGAQKDIRISLMDEWCEIFLIADTHVIEGEVGQTVSLLPFSPVVTGITLKGFEYPLENGAMEVGKPYGISNRLTSTRGIISVCSGYLLAIRYFRKDIFPKGDV
jgi:thiamine pyrophosphokinase